MRRTRSVLLLSVSLLCVCAAAADAQTQAERTETLKRKINIGPRGLLDLSNLAGRIAVTSGTDEVEIEAVKHVRYTSDAVVKEAMSRVRIDITERHDRVVVRTVYDRPVPRGRDWVRVDYVVRVPTETTLELRSVTGDIELRDLQGEIRIQSDSGNQRLVNIRNLELARTVSGDIEATDVNGVGDATMSTVSGTVRARNLKTPRLEIRTISGDLELLDLQCDRLEVASVSGNVQFRGTLSPTGRYNLRSQYGNLALAVSTKGFDLDAHSFSGSIQTDFPITVHETTSNTRIARPSSNPQRGTVRLTNGTRTVRGTYEQGGAMVGVRTLNGNITITRN
jgi:DUF4097 and DUF4098 domain-containing protein YvlB